MNACTASLRECRSARDCRRVSGRMDHKASHPPYTPPPSLHTPPPPPPVSASGRQAAAASAPSAAPVAARPGPASPWHPAGAARSPGSSPPPPGSWPPALSGSGNSRSVSQLVSDWILASCQPHRVTSG